MASSGSMTFLQLAERVLSEEGKPLSPKEVWQLAQSKGYDKLLGGVGKTPDQSLSAQLHVSAKKAGGPFEKIGTNPVQFQLKKTQAAPAISTLVPTKATPLGHSEAMLHPFLAYFCSTGMDGIYCKTIQHHLSTKKQFGKWLHPDVVGWRKPWSWHTITSDLSNSLMHKSVRLFSFEIKLQLQDADSLREAFFQTVSNSSWAHEGYLVAELIHDKPEFRAELSRLSQSHRIGVIQLNTSDPDLSKVLYPATPREELDWEAVNKLVTYSEPFRRFLSRVQVDSQYSHSSIPKSEYDEVKNKPDLTATISPSKAAPVPSCAGH